MLTWNHGLRGKIIRTVLCCVMYKSCAHALTYEQFLKMSVGLGFLYLIFVCFPFCFRVTVCFYCVRFSFFSVPSQEIVQEERISEMPCFVSSGT